METLLVARAPHENGRTLTLAIATPDALHASPKYLIRLWPLGAVLRRASRRATEFLYVTRKAHGHGVQIQPE